MKRVLIVKMWALGDLLMATPMIAALRAKYPGVHLTWVVDISHGELLRGHPGIDDLVVLDSGRWRRLLRKGNLPGWLRRTAELRRDMAAHRFDAAINCHPEKWWTAALCVAPQRIGLYPSPEPRASARFYTLALGRPQNPPVHDTLHYLQATRALGCPDADLRLTIGETEDETTFLCAFEQQHGMGPETPLVALAPFTTSETKTWDPEAYAEVAARLSRQFPGVRVVLTGGAKDGAAARRIAARSVQTGGEPPMIAEGTNLRQYVALLRRASLVISGDTSALHIAAALGTPYVTLFGPTEPALLAPLRASGHVLRNPPACAPCWSNHCRNSIFRECMKRITPDDVLSAAAPYLDGSVTAGRLLRVL